MPSEAARVIRVDFVSPIHCDPDREDGILATPDSETGFLHLDGRMTCTGVFDYRDDDGNEWGELRTESDVFDDLSLASFRGVVVTNDHPDEFVGTRNVKDVQVGHVGTNVRRSGEFVRSSVVITDAHTIIEVQSGKKELSCGYSVELVDDVGELDGKSHTHRQTNIRGNHLAIVDVGRAGPECALIKRGDGAAITIEATMAAPKKADDKKADDKKTAPKTVKDLATEMIAALKKADSVNRSDEPSQKAQAVIDLLTRAIEFGDEGILRGALLSASEMLGEAEPPPAPDAPPEPDGAMTDGEHEEDPDESVLDDDGKDSASKDAADALRAKLDASEAEHKRYRAHEDARIDARVKLTCTVREICPDLNTDGKSEADLMRAVVLTVSPDLKGRLDANRKSVGYLRSSFDAAVDLHASRDRNSDSLLRLVHDTHVEDDDDNNDPDKAYADYLARRDARSNRRA